MNQIRLLRWHDLPLVYHLIGHGTSFDARFSLTTGDDGLRHSLLSNTRQTRLYVRPDDGGAFGALGYPTGVLCASLAYIAPALDRGGNDAQWLDLIGGMCLLAGQQGIVAIRAEVGDDTLEFSALREAEFGVYAHQTLWERPPAPVEAFEPCLRAATTQEVGRVLESINARAPSLIKQITLPPGADAECYVLDARNTPQAIAAIYRGSRRALVDVYVSLEAHECADIMIRGLLSILDAKGYGITCRLRHDMEWLGNRLTDAGFGWLGSQAIMARHTLAHIRQPVLKEVKVRRGAALPTTDIREPQPVAPDAADKTIQPA